MRNKWYAQILTVSIFLLLIGNTACKTPSATSGTADPGTAANRNLPPDRVDIRGSIIMRQYNQGQVVIEVESFAPQNTRYNRAFVLVLPTTQIIGTDGRSISLSELHQGQQVAVLLRGGGKGHFVGMGTARKMWLENIF
ncbi:hypothetical protein [Adhaeribacter aquaticus]|uniref:hypothetical protein n=1 Tax=Adhaeribacter aquaticus TaxID=299567 RepID=UPI0003FE4994|nr:hypothetical protein [Adhaeribacter aquaticus]